MLVEAGFVSGLDFSRAVKRCKMDRALAPEGDRCLATRLFPQAVQKPALSELARADESNGRHKGRDLDTVLAAEGRLLIALSRNRMHLANRTPRQTQRAALSGPSLQSFVVLS